jgi:6-phosphogluconolactonase
MVATNIRIFPAARELTQALGEFVARLSANAVKARERFTVGLSGGSLPKLLADGLRDRQDVEWDAWEVFFCDER